MMGRGVTALVGLLVLVGCYVPDQFSARVSMNADGSYGVGFDGRLAHLAATAELEQGVIAEDDPWFDQVARAMAADPHVQVASRAEAATFELRLQAAGTLAVGETVTLPPGGAVLVQISRPQADRMVLQTPGDPGPDLRRAAVRLGLRMRGSLEVRVDGEVIEHNADDAGGLLGAVYRWRYEDPTDPTPFIAVRVEPVPE